MEHTQKKIRSASPDDDVIVAVGSGDNNRQEFECYKIALSFACPYFDAMLSTNMTENNESRIEFPDKDPVEWKVFYSFIDPNKIGIPNGLSATINDENVMTIVPWFHEFSMEAHLAQCDQFLYEKVVSISHTRKVDHGSWKSTVLTSFWDINDPTKHKEKNETVQQIIQLLEFSCIYDLQKTKDETERSIRALLHYDHLSKTNHLFDISALKVLTNLLLPLAHEEEDGYKYLVSEGKSPVLWNCLDEMEFYNQLEGLSLEEVNSNPMLPMFIQSHIDFMARLHESDNIKYSARGLVRDLLINAPNKLYNNMSHTADRNTAGRMCLMGILKDASTKHKKAFKKLQITLPEEYNQV